MGRTALVLSSGGMFGAYQAGAWKAIAARVQPDLVVGASVGGLNAWAIAGGCKPDSLISRWLDTKAGDALRLLPRRRLRLPEFDPGALQQTAENLCREFTPKIPLGVVLTRLPGFLHSLFQYPDLTPQHLQASCSMLLLLPPVEIGGARYVDGGLFEKLPLWAAIRMGATRIIAVDAMPVLKDAWMRTANLLTRVVKRPYVLPQGIEVTMVSPSEALGDKNDGVFWNRRNAERFVALGSRDAEAALRGEDMAGRNASE